MKIQKRLYTIFFLSLVIFAFSLLYVRDRNAKIQDHLSIIADQEIRLVQQTFGLESEVRNVSNSAAKILSFIRSTSYDKEILIRNLPALIKESKLEMDESIKNTQVVLANMKETISGAGAASDAARLGVSSFEEEVEGLKAIVNNLRPELEFAVNNDSLENLEKKYEEVVKRTDFISKAIQNDFHLISATSRSSVIKDSNSIYKFVFISSGVLLLCVAFIYFYIYRKIFRPLNFAKRVAYDVKRGRRKIFSGNFENNELGDFLNSVRSMTYSLREYEHKIEFERNKAQQSEKSLINFLKNLNHEVRNPLFVISGLINELLENMKEGHEKDVLREANLEINHIHHVFDEVMDLLTLRLGNMDVQDSPITMTELTRYLTKEFHARSQQKGIGFNINVDKALEDVMVRSDSELLKRILFEVIDNSIKNTFVGGIDILFKMSDENFSIQVKDTGEGIAREKLDRYFTGYGAAGEDNINKGSGLGLGLLLVSKLAKNLDGKIIYKTAPGKGCCVTINFEPEIITEISATNKNLLPDSLDTFSMNEALMAMGGLRVLVVDDDEENYFLLKEQLKNFFILDHAINGKMAMEKIKSETYDIVIMDLQMPVMDGIEASKLIHKYEKEQGVHIPIVALTGYAQEKEERTANEGEFSAYCLKPIRKKALVRTLFEVSNKQDATEEMEQAV